MSTKIYYFSGTGNCLAVSRELKKHLNDETSICSIAEFINKETVKADADVLGFVFPVHFMNIPDILKSFIKKLTFSTNTYIFAIATCNGVPGESLFNLNKCLVKKGQSLSLGFVVSMPGNALVTPPEIVTERLNNYKGRVAEIAENINKRNILKFEGEYNIKSHIASYTLKTLGKRLYLTPKNASSTCDCVGCGTCEKVCPLNNIKIVNKKPQWGHNCSTCLACFHWCPKKAVKGGVMLNKRERYHNPEISIMDMKQK